MLIAIKLAKGFVRALNSAAEPWQMAVGAGLGTALGFMPLWIDGPNPLALVLLGLALVINCHLGTLFLTLAIGKGLALALGPLAVVVGNALDGVARVAADVPLLHASGWSHTGWLGLALLGVALAPAAAIGMARLAIYFRTRLRDRLLERRRLVLAGKLGSNSLLLRLVCWFFDL